VPGEPLAPRRGIPSGRGPRTVCWRQGSGADGLPFICPFPSAIAEGRRLALPPDGRRHPRSGASNRSDGTVLDTRRPPLLRPGSPIGAGEGPGATPPRSPALNSVIEGSGILARGWRLRLWAPFLSSVFLFLLPFLCLPGELRAFALLGAPLLPLSSRTPLLSWLRGYGRAPLPAAPSSGGGAMELVHRPAGGSSCYWRMSRDATPHGATAPPPRWLSSASPIHPPALSGLQSRTPGPSRGGDHRRTVCSLVPAGRRPHSGPGGRSFQSTSLVM
jgi:hypothetical protein